MNRASSRFVRKNNGLPLFWRRFRLSDRAERSTGNCRPALRPVDGLHGQTPPPAPTASPHDNQGAGWSGGKR